MTRDKTAQATKIANGALGLFASAHNELQRAIALLEAAQADHHDQAADHLNKAHTAGSLLASHRASAAKLAEFLPGQGA